MPKRFRQLTQPPTVRAAQNDLLGQSAGDLGTDELPEPLGQTEAAFIAARDSFYLATVSETGWPYVQHRGGPKGFLWVLSPRILAFADYPGNRQLVSAGNVRANGKVAIILVDYPGRERLKILGHARWLKPADDPELARTLEVPPGREAVGLVVIEVEAFDWNCPQYLTPRFTEAEIEERTRRE